MAMATSWELRPGLRPIESTVPSPVQPTSTSDTSMINIDTSGINIDTGSFPIKPAVSIFVTTGDMKGDDSHRNVNVGNGKK